MIKYEAFKGNNNKWYVRIKMYGISKLDTNFSEATEEEAIKYANFYNNL